jgi:hypothetical protein
MELREMRATVRERLHSSETALRDSRLQVVALQHKEAEHFRRLTLLENDRRGRQPFEDLQTLIHLQETDALNKDLQRNLATQKVEVNAIGEQLEQREEELQLLQTQCAETQVLLEEARQKATLLQNEKLSAEKQAVVEREEMRSQLSKAASLELANLKSKHLDLIQQSKAKDSPTAEKYREAASQLILTRQEKERIEREVTTTKAALETLQKEWQDEVSQKLVSTHCRAADLMRRLHLLNGFANNSSNFRSRHKKKMLCTRVSSKNSRVRSPITKLRMATSKLFSPMRTRRRNHSEALLFVNLVSP